MTEFERYVSSRDFPNGWPCLCDHGYERHALPSPPGDGRCIRRNCSYTQYRPAP